MSSINYTYRRPLLQQRIDVCKLYGESAKFTNNVNLNGNTIIRNLNIEENITINKNLNIKYLDCCKSCLSENLIGFSWRKSPKTKNDVEEYGEHGEHDYGEQNKVHAEKKVDEETEVEKEVETEEEKEDKSYETELNHKKKKDINKYIQDIDQEIRDERLELCLNCIFASAIDFQAKQMWFDKNGDPLSNLRRDFQQQIDSLKESIRIMKDAAENKQNNLGDK